MIQSRNAESHIALHFWPVKIGPILAGEGELRGNHKLSSKTLMKVKFSQFFPFLYRHFPITFIFFFFTCLFLAVLGLCCCMDFFLSCGKQGLLSTCSALVCHCRGFSCYGAWALGTVGFSSCGFWALEHRLNIVAHRLTCSMTCGILPYQGSNPCLLHWQVDSLPLSHQGSPLLLFNHMFCSHLHRIS